MKKLIIMFLSLMVLISTPVTGAMMYENPDIRPIGLIRLTLKNLKTISMDDIRHAKIIKDECAI